MQWLNDNITDRLPFGRCCPYAFGVRGPGVSEPFVGPNVIKSMKQADPFIY